MRHRSFCAAFKSYRCILCISLSIVLMASTLFLRRSASAAPTENSGVGSGFGDMLFEYFISCAPAIQYEPVELICQYPDLPNGCEVTSLAMVLNAAGYQTDGTELFENYMPKQSFILTFNGLYGPDPEEYYAGDAASPVSWYCFEGPVIRAANKFLQDSSSPYRAISVTGLSRDTLEAYISAGIPVIVWVTLYYDEPTISDLPWILFSGEEYYPYTNLHCVVLTEITDAGYVIANPLGEWEEISPEEFWSSFDAMGRRAVIIG